MPFIRTDRLERTTEYPNPACIDNDPNCDLTRYLLVLIIFVVIIAFFMCICRSFMRLVIYKRNRNPTQNDTDVIYPRDVVVRIYDGIQTSINQHHRRSHQNFGFIDPPPRYDQIFKRGGGAPSVITTREAPSVTRSSGDAGLPPSYEQAAIISRSQAVSLSQNTFREVPLTAAVDMEHPVMPSPSSTVLDMESEIANIQNHAHACVHRYDSNHAREFSRTAASVSAPSSSAALPELEAPEGGPPGYDAISLVNETAVSSAS